MPWVRFSCFFWALLPTFLVFSFLIPVCLYVYLLRVSSSMQQSSSVTTLTKYVVLWRQQQQQQQQQQIMHPPRYVIRTSQRIRTHSYIHTYATGEPGTSTYHTCSNIYSAWYELVLACNSSSGWNFSLIIRAHTTTKIHELKTVLDTSRGRWRCK